MKKAVKLLHHLASRRCLLLLKRIKLWNIKIQIFKNMQNLPSRHILDNFSRIISGRKQQSTFKSGKKQQSLKIRSTLEFLLCYLKMLLYIMRMAYHRILICKTHCVLSYRRTYYTPLQISKLQNIANMTYTVNYTTLFQITKLLFLSCKYEIYLNN